MKIPQHLAIIMDGNGRWAKNKKKSRIFGHQEGMKRVREIVEYSKELRIPYLTLFAFSTENWSRPKDEVKFLMSLLEEYTKNEVNKLKKQNIKLNFIGDLSVLSEKLRNLLKNAMELTKNCNDMTLNIAISYGGKQEIIFAVKKILEDFKNKKIQIDDINEDIFTSYLFTKDLPEPDLLIRTSGEMRISNFMLWQLAYTELYFTETLWPDFNKEELIKALKDFSKRQRRFGKIFD